MVAQDDRVTIGKIERPFGIRGAVKVRSLSDVPGRFERLDAVRVVAATGRASDRRITHVRRAGETYIVQFAGITSPEEAGMLRGSVIQVPPQDRATPTDGVFYQYELVGMTVVDQEGRDLGTVETTWELPGHSIIVVRNGDREVLIPATKEFVTAVDLSKKRMTVRVIEGMVEDRHAL